MENHIKLEVNKISNLVTIKTIFVSDAVKAYFRKENIFSYTLTIATDRTSKFNENSFYLGLNESSERVGYYSFTSDKRASKFLVDLKDSIGKLIAHIDEKPEFINEKSLELTF